MKNIKDFIEEKSIAKIGVVIMLIAILVTVGQFIRLNNTVEASYDSQKLGEAILKSIDLAEKKEEQIAIEANVKNSTEDGLMSIESDPMKFFNQSLFIGDSRIQGLMIFSGVKATGYSEIGLNVSTAVSKQTIFYEGQKLTIPQALNLGQKFDKIIIKMGLNELGWKSVDFFKQEYSELVGHIKEAQPEALIYIHAILPVTATKNNDGSIYNNTRIAEFNGAIKIMAEEQGVNYIDVTPMLADDQGFIPEAAAASDGIHLKSDFCKQWLVFIKNAIQAL